MTENPLNHSYVRYNDEEKDALYVDGELVMYRDSYLVDEYLESLLNVDVRSDDEFLLGTDSSPAKTLGEIAEYVSVRDDALARAEELERQAAELRKQAAELRK